MNRSIHRLGRPRRALVFLTALTAAAAVALPTTGASAAKPAEPPVVTISAPVVTSSVTPPQTPGAPNVFVAVGAPFTLDVSFSTSAGPAPISETRDVTLEVTVAGSEFVGSRPTVLVPKGKTSATIEAIVLTKAANGVTLTVTAVAPAREVRGVVPGTSTAVDVAKDFTSVPVSDEQAAAGFTVSRNGIGTTCSLEDRETCVDLVLPGSPGNGTEAFFSTGVCGDATVGACRSGDLMQVLAEFTLTETNPATFIIKCSKALCGKGGINRNRVNVSVLGSGALVEAPACARRGILEEGQPFCVDYVQARRDGAGVTYLPVLMPVDARFSI